MDGEHEAFALLQPADRILRSYLATIAAGENRKLIDELWASIAPHDPHHYRGIGCILDGLPPAPDDDMASWLEALHADPSDPLLEARLAIGCFSDDSDARYDLLHTARQVSEVMALIPETETIQVVTVRRDEFVEAPTVLGFDVGYWGVDYSIICDAAVAPQWHPPDPSDFRVLASLLVRLNENFLFSTYEAAQTFQERYSEFPWAEQETYPGEFAVIQLETVDPRRLTSQWSWRGP